MKLIEGIEYQIESIAYGVVRYEVAGLGKRLFNGKPVVLFSNMFFSSTGQALTFDRHANCLMLDSEPLIRVSEVDQDRKRRHDGGKVLVQISNDISSLRGGRNSDVFSCGRASDEVLAQLERAQAEVAKLRALVESSHGS